MTVVVPAVADSLVIVVIDILRSDSWFRQVTVLDGRVRLFRFSRVGDDYKSRDCS